MPGKAPTLPVRKMAGGRRLAAPSAKGSLPIAESAMIQLEDGTEVPIRIPPGMPAAQAQALIAYLQANPAAAKAAHEQAQAILKNPAMANAFANMNSPQQQMMQERLMLLKDDPDFKEMFEDMKTNGASAFQKYWDDTEMMLKISQKLRALDVGQNGEAAAAEGAAEGAKKLIANLHDAAKHGEVEAATRFIEEGADVNALNERGISALGVAVGFNRLDVVKLLLAKGADLTFRDPKKNTLMHYAAGYGRLAIAKALHGAGAELSAENEAKQTPLDVSRMNGEKEVAKWLEGEGATANTTTAPPAPSAAKTKAKGKKAVAAKPAAEAVEAPAEAEAALAQA